MYQGYAVGWFTLALINAGMAHAFGRSRTITFLASLLLGPFVTAVLVVIGKKVP